MRSRRPGDARSGPRPRARSRSGRIEDAVAAAVAIEEARRACAAAERQGLRLDGAALERWRDLHRRGADAAQRGAEKLARALESAGSARRAVSAYRR